MWRLLILLGMVVALPFVIVFGLPIGIPISVVDSSCYWRYCRNCNFGLKIVIIFLYFLLGCVLNVLAIPLALALLVPALIFFIGWYLYERCKLRNRYKEALRIRKNNTLIEN